MENRLRVLRGERNWSQQDLAERLEVSRQSVNAIETGKYDPSLPLAFRIAELFERPIEEIFVSPSRRSSKAIRVILVFLLAAQLASPIVDCRFDLDDPVKTATWLDALPGALGHGLFLREVDAAYIADGTVVSRLERVDLSR